MTGRIILKSRSKYRNVRTVCDGRTMLGSKGDRSFFLHRKHCKALSAVHLIPAMPKDTP